MKAGMNAGIRTGRRIAAPDLAAATISESAGIRYLHLGTPWVQGAMRLDRPRTLELEYVQRMMAWLLLRPWEGLARGHAVQLGLGAASLTRYCHGVLRMRTTAVEINPSVIAAGRAWFRLPADGPRLAVVQDDAARWIAETARAGSIDALCIDLYDHEAAAPALDSAAFYADCAAALADGGTLAVNLFGRDASFERSIARIARAFPAGQVAWLRPTREGNTIALALKSDTFPDRAALAGRAENIETRLGLPARKWLRLLRPWPPPESLLPILPPA
jgi:spermidine synthase